LGNLYGTTGTGGSSTFGTVFELDASGTETVLHSFTGSPGDGANPGGKLVRYAGNIYGTTQEGGGTECKNSGTGCGTVFELSRGKETVVYSFAEVSGNFPVAGLARDASGNLYGTTFWGGNETLPACESVGCGAMFEVSQGQETILHTFSGTDGMWPSGSLSLDRSGNLYGTTGDGGTFGLGTVFELSPKSDGTWTEHILYSFRGKSDGGNPDAGVVMDGKGSLYGTAFSGGHVTKAFPQGCGVVFKLRQNSDGTWMVNVLHAFGETADDGIYPIGSLVRDKLGNLYGTTNIGGAAGDGIVFKVAADGEEKVLHTFTSGPTDGAFPAVGLTMDASGNLYGVTQAGGAGSACAGLGFNGCGTVFKITP
jgi:uncharacterized repeat protein (TIGR03803 family)